MRETTISGEGKISLPADLRQRWHTSRVEIEDRGDSIVVRPIPDDPISTALGALEGRRPVSNEIRRVLRDEESAREKQRHTR